MQTSYFVTVTDKVWESEYSDCSDDEAVEVTDVKMPSPAKVTQLAKAINNNKVSLTLIFC